MNRYFFHFSKGSLFSVLTYIRIFTIILWQIPASLSKSKKYQTIDLLQKAYMVKKIVKKYPVLDYIALAIGAAVMGIGIGVFLVDAKVVPGGVSGLSMTTYYVTDGYLPVGLMIWVFNIPLYLWGLKELGKQFGVRTFYAFTLNSFFIDLFRGDIPGLGGFALQNSQTVKDLMVHDFFFLILIGAVLLGMGLGIVFKFKGTTGGSDIVAAIMQKKWGIKPGQAIMIIDLFVILLAGFVIDMKGLAESTRPALSLTFYALFLLFVSSKLIDVIIEGFDYAGVAYIISNKTDEIGEYIIKEMGRGATALKARGMYSESDKEVIITTLPIKDLMHLKEKVHEIDPSAFMMLNNVYEVLGEGFRRRI